MTERNVKDIFEEYFKTRSIELRNKLIIHYLKTAERVAKKYTNICNLTEDDALDMAYEGLIKAIESYNEYHSTEPAIYIIGYISSFIESKIYTNPLVLKEVYFKFQKYKKEVEQETNEEYDGSPEMLEMIIDKMIADGVMLNEPGNREILRIVLGRELSTMDIKGTKMDFDSGEYLDAKIDRELQEKAIKEVLETLSDKERKVIILRFGLEDGKTRTLEEVGQMFGVTKERIRQIEVKALSKLRNSSISSRLKTIL